MPSSPPSLSLLDLFNASTILLGTTATTPHKLGSPRPSFSSILSSRLSLFSQSYPTLLAQYSPLPTEQASLERLTAETALKLLESINLTLSTSPNKEKERAPTFSVNQIKGFKTLAGIIARWGICGNLDKDERVLPINLYGTRTGLNGLDKGKGKEKERFKELDQGKEVERENKLKRIIEGLIEKVLFNEGKEGEDRKQLRMIIMPQVVLPLMGPIIYLSSSSRGKEERGKYENYLKLLFDSNPLTVLLSHLLQLLSTSLPQSPYRTLLTTHLTSLLLRPGGVRSLLIVVVGVGAGGGEEEEETGNEKKLGMVWRLLGNDSGQEDSKIYFDNIISQLFLILSSSVDSSLNPPNSRLAPPRPSTSVPPPSILRAISYLLTHFLLSPLHIDSNSLILKTLHSSFLPLTYSSSQERSILTQEELLQGLTRLSILISNAPQLPSLLSTLIPPHLISNFFSLLSFLEETPSTNLFKQKNEGVDKIREETKSILYILGKTESVSSGSGEGEGELVRNVREAVEYWEKGEEFGMRRKSEEDEDEEDEGGEWRVEWKWTKEGEVQTSWINDARDQVVEEEESIRFIDPISDSDSNSIPTGQSLIRVSPEVIVDWLREVGRKELSASLFLRWLDELRVLQQAQVDAKEEDQVGLAKKSVVRLQLILKMVENLGSEILTSPTEIVAFIGNTLDVSEETGRSQKQGDKKRAVGGGLGLEDLKIIDDDENEGEEVEEVEEREFDVASGLGVGSGKEELVLTAITLLLAVLEANPNLSISSTPLLRSINSRLSTLSESLSTTSDLIPPLLREAQMVLQLRETSLQFSTGTSQGKERDPDGMESSREKYQEALKLLQDPLLPVRAQGLHLLKSLIKPTSSTSTTTTSQNLLKTDPALLPAILDIFLNSLTEDDSFLYLNAVQGLSTLVDVFGRQVVKGLLEVYTGSKRGGKIEVREVGEGEKGQREVDKRLRVGEALVQVVQRAGEALATLQDLLLPPLLITLRQSTLPIPLRASSITILATMVETSPIAMMRVAGELGEAMRQLLEIETVSYRANPTINAEGGGSTKNGKGRGKSSVLIEEVKEDEATSEEDDEEDFKFSLPTPKPTSNPHSSRPEELVDPTSTTSKHPSLRRAALLFLSLLVRTTIKSRYDSFEMAQKDAMEGLGESLVKDGRLRMPGDRPVIESRFDRSGREVGVDEGMSARERERLKITLEYVRETDRDELVRFQAGEVLEEMNDAGL